MSNDPISEFADNIAHSDDETDAPMPTSRLAQAVSDLPQANISTKSNDDELLNDNQHNVSDNTAIITQHSLPRNKMSPKQRLVADALNLYPNKSLKDLNKMKVSELKSLIENKKLVDTTARVSLKPREELEQMTAGDLKKELGETVNNNLQSIIKKEPVTLPSQSPNEMAGNLLSSMQVDIKANTLYNFHQVGAAIIECVSETDSIQQRTGSNLAGLSQDLRDDKVQFMEILKDVYREHHTDIDQFITPLTVYGLFMIEKMSTRFVDNKKKISNGELVKSPLKLERVLGLQQE